MGKEKISIIGSGNWGSAIARLAGQNVKKYSDEFDESIRVWVYEEEFEGNKLTEIINSTHENKKYLPGVKLPDNVVAIPDMKEAVDGATALVFVMPHQFLSRILDQLQPFVPKGVKALTLIKGVEVKETNIDIFADIIEKKLGASVSALSGANIAPEVARDKFSETTIGYRKKEEGEMWKKLFDTPKFRVSLVSDVVGVSLCGALKNIIAVGAGFTEGLGWGNNSQAAIMRIGLLEMKTFCMEFFDGVKEETFLEQSAGVADVITSCKPLLRDFTERYGSPSKEFVKQKTKVRTAKTTVKEANNDQSFEEIERDMLNGQKLQGIHTAKEIHNFLRARKRTDGYPLFENIYKICWEGLDPEKLTDGL